MVLMFMSAIAGHTVPLGVACVLFLGGLAVAMTLAGEGYRALAAEALEKCFGGEHAGHAQ